MRLKSNNIRNREPGYYEPRVIYNKYDVLFVKKKKKKIHVIVIVPYSTRCEMICFGGNWLQEKKSRSVI